MSAMADWIVWNLDPDGYLRESLSGLAETAGVPLADLTQALTIVQSLDPDGVGARSLSECLLLQLRAQENPDPVAMELVERHIEAVAEKRYDALARTLGQPLARIVRAVERIRRLEPRPGRAFDNAPPQTVRPEVVIVKAGSGYCVRSYADEVPCDGTNERQGAGDSGQPDPQGHLAHQVHTAGRVVTALERGRLTLRSIAQSIVRHQVDFLRHGLAHLRPLSLRQVAADLGVHVSTVSRAVAHRYVDTPHGVLPLRAFFTGRLPADATGLVSPVAAREVIRELIEQEDPAAPLPDGKIARALAAGGIRIARRTVVKYRDILGIASAPMRKVARELTGSVETLGTGRAGLSATRSPARPYPSAWASRS
jgi:RNA polymerase sigma-54 factor